MIEIDKNISMGKDSKGKEVFKKVWKPRFGFPYWLYNSEGVIENKNYILDENTDLEDFKIYLNNEQVLILTKE